MVNVPVNIPGGSCIVPQSALQHDVVVLKYDRAGGRSGILWSSHCLPCSQRIWTSTSKCIINSMLLNRSSSSSSSSSKWIILTGPYGSFPKLHEHDEDGCDSWRQGDTWCSPAPGWLCRVPQAHQGSHSNKTIGRQDVLLSSSLLLNDDSQ